MSTPLRRRLGVLAGRDFRSLFFARAISLFGNSLAVVAIAFAVLDVTGSASDLGLVLAARALPQLLLLLIGGVWADRLPRQYVLIATDLLNCAAQAVTAALLIAGSAELWQLVALQAVAGTASAFFYPALTGLVPATVEASDLQQANAVLQLTYSGASIVGGATAGALVAAVGPGWTLAADAGTFAASAAFLSRLALAPRVAPPRRSVIAELREGWHAVVSRTWLWVIVVHFGVYNAVFYGSLFVLGPLVAKRALGGAAAWGAILAAHGAGTLAGSIVALRLRPRRPLLASYVLLLVEPPLLFLLAAQAPLTAVVAAAALAGVSASFFIVLWETALQENVPRELLSRVSAYDWLGALALMPVGYTAAGWIGGSVGVARTLWGAGGLGAASILLVLLTVADLRRLESRDVQPAPVPAPLERS